MNITVLNLSEYILFQDIPNTKFAIPMIEAYLFSEIDGKWALRQKGGTQPFAIVASEAFARELERLWNARHTEIIYRKINTQYLERKPTQ